MNVDLAAIKATQPLVERKIVSGFFRKGISGISSTIGHVLFASWMFGWFGISSDPLTFSLPDTTGIEDFNTPVMTRLISNYGTSDNDIYIDSSGAESDITLSKAGDEGDGKGDVKPEVKDNLFSGFKQLDLEGAKVSDKIDEARKDELLRIARQRSLRDQLTEDIERMEGRSPADKVLAFATFIQQSVGLNWNRPGSARNNMKAELSISMTYDGTIRTVDIASSSGDSAFDESVVNAVWRVGRIVEFELLDRDIFDENFKNFRLVFSPEDLTR